VGSGEVGLGGCRRPRCTPRAYSNSTYDMHVSSSSYDMHVSSSTRVQQQYIFVHFFSSSSFLWSATTTRMAVLVAKTVKTKKGSGTL
jgi:hypothetical protein